MANAVASGLTNVGDIDVKSQGNDLYFNFVNADGEVMRTDLIDKGKIMSITVTPAAKQARKSKATFVVLDPNAKADTNDDNTPNLIGGQDYMLNITIPQMYYKSDQVRGFKYGVVHATNSMSDSDFYKKMALSLVANMSREAWPILKVYLTTATSASNVTFGTNTTLVTEQSTETSLNGTYTAIVIDEAEQAWNLGRMTQEPVFYEAKSDEILVSGDYMKWGVETEFVGDTTTENGKKIAEMEWFYHGERGDIYREAAWPNNWPNHMMADPTKKYDTIDIHYYWNGANHAIQKSEKDITIACPVGTGETQVAQTLVGKIATEIGDSDLTYSATGVTTVIY